MMDQFKRIISLFIIIILAGTPVIDSQSAPQIRYSVTEDNKIEIMYDVQKSADYIISLSISTDGGETFPLVPLHVYGDIGRKKLIQGNAVITWDVFQDIDRFDGQFVIKLEMTEAEKKPISKWIYIAGALIAGGVFVGFQTVDDTKSPTSEPSAADETGSIKIDVTFPY